MKKRTLPLLLSMAIAPATFAAIQLNGETISDFTITHSNGNIFISTTGGTTTPEPVEPTPVDPTPVDPTPPPIDTGSCGTENQDTVVGTLNWRSVDGVIDVPRSSPIAYKFTTTSSTAYNGTVTVGAQTGGGSVKRHVWISACPGGPAIANQYNGCDVTSTEPSFKWSQEASPRLPTTCKLNINTDYYLNFQNSNCDRTSCGVYLQNYTNGRY